MHMELDRLTREVDIKFTRQDAVDMQKVNGFQRVSGVVVCESSKCVFMHIGQPKSATVLQPRLLSPCEDLALSGACDRRNAATRLQRSPWVWVPTTEGLSVSK